MLDGVNDSDRDARELVRLLRGIPAKVNLIPFNPWPGAPYRCSPPERIRAFAAIVARAGYPSPVRTPRGPRHPGRLRPAEDRERAPAPRGDRRLSHEALPRRAARDRRSCWPCCSPAAPRCGVAAAARAARAARADRPGARSAGGSRRGRRRSIRSACSAWRRPTFTDVILGARPRRPRSARQGAAGAAQRRRPGPRPDPGVARCARPVPRAGQVRLRLRRQLRRVRPGHPRLLSRHRLRADPSPADRLARPDRDPDRDAACCAACSRSSGSSRAATSAARTRAPPTCSSRRS